MMKTTAIQSFKEVDVLVCQVFAVGGGEHGSVAALAPSTPPPVLVSSQRLREKTAGSLRISSATMIPAAPVLARFAVTSLGQRTLPLATTGTPNGSSARTTAATQSRFADPSRRWF
eukprot:CAMPEP_0171593618 /NCGR_PEP_ID=MMETSP0990-20121206/219_1 /TAXON_ID=483369 /ORGANISM="non described non described, Strain CCMP2098" /LENGTH=115 /DNA_ID=CAMNT_0012154187 /DNA_START=450 /DNA_END=795 /DNA_ORIENTATION=+